MKAIVNNVDCNKPGDVFYTIAYGIKPGDKITVLDSKRDNASGRNRKTQPTLWYYFMATLTNHSANGVDAGSIREIRIPANQCTVIEN